MNGIASDCKDNLMQIVDKQAIEILGRNHLVRELLLNEIEVAIPMRDRGVDLIAYKELGMKSFLAFPIQLKVSSNKSFSIDIKYQKISNLKIAYVWRVRDLINVEIYVLTYKQVFEIAKKLKMTDTASWIKNGKYITSKPSEELIELLQPFRARKDMWEKFKK